MYLQWTAPLFIGISKHASSPRRRSGHWKMHHTPFGFPYSSSLWLWGCCARWGLHRYCHSARVGRRGTPETCDLQPRYRRLEICLLSTWRGWVTVWRLGRTQRHFQCWRGWIPRLGAWQPRRAGCCYQTRIQNWLGCVYFQWWSYDHKGTGQGPYGRSRGGQW